MRAMGGSRLLVARGVLAAVSLWLAPACVPEDPPEGPRTRPRAFALATAEPRAEPNTRRPAPSSSARKAPRTARPRPLGAKGPAASDPLIDAPFSDDFERTSLGASYRTTSSAWRISGGRLCATRAHNQPVWLARRIPRNARIEFDAQSSSPDGDIKVEVWGDGESGATKRSYDDATSYVVIFGGWKNSFHVLARKNEHGRDRKQLELDDETNDARLLPVEPDRTYHFRVERRDGKTVRWFVDDIEILSFHDPEPLAGPGHDHFGFNDWETPVCFDNLAITPLD